MRNRAFLQRVTRELLVLITIVLAWLRLGRALQGVMRRSRSTAVPRHRRGVARRRQSATLGVRRPHGSLCSLSSRGLRGSWSLPVIGLRLPTAKASARHCHAPYAHRPVSLRSLPPNLNPECCVLSAPPCRALLYMRRCRCTQGSLRQRAQCEAS